MADDLGQHVTLEVECSDRMSLNVSQPRWQSDRGVVSLFRFHRGHTFASSALMEPISVTIHTPAISFGAGLFVARASMAAVMKSMG